MLHRKKIVEAYSKKIMELIMVIYTMQSIHPCNVYMFFFNHNVWKP